MSACLIEHACINTAYIGSMGHRAEAYSNVFEKALALVATKPLSVIKYDLTQSTSDNSTTVAAALPLHIALAKRDEHLPSNPPKQSSRRRSRR